MRWRTYLMPDPIQVRPEDAEALRGFLDVAIPMDGASTDPWTDVERDQIAAASRLLADLRRAA